MNPPPPQGGRIELVTPGRKHLVQIASRLLPGWTARQAEGLLLRPPRRRGRAAEVLDLWGRRGRLAVGDQHLAYWAIGPQDAPRVVLVHGWGGYGAQLAGFVPGLLERGFAAILFDHLGHGVSEGVGGVLPDFMAGLAAVVHQVGEPAGLIAHSLGAAAALHALRERQFGCRRVVLIGAPGSIEVQLKTLSRRVGLGRDAHHTLRARLEARYRPMADLDQLDGLPVPDCEPLLVHDQDDQEVDFAQLARLRQAWPGCRTLATRGWGHHRVLRAPEVIAAAVRHVGGGSD